MDQETDENSAEKPAGNALPNVPPPDLTRRPPAPESPLDHVAKSKPAIPPAEVAVNVRVRTGDGTEEDESPKSGIAPFNTRVMAVLVDCVVMIGMVIGLNLLLPGFAHRLSWLVGCAYLVTRDALPFLGGQSVGKKAMGLRAVTREGKPLTENWEASLIRNGVLIIPLFALVELFILLTREEKPERGLRLGDEWAKTKVIIEEKPVEPEAEG